MVGFNRQVVNFIPKLPGAYATAVLTSDNTNVADGDTVTIGSRVYRFKTVIAQIDDILIGASADASLTNLANCINGLGTPGTDYFTGSVKNTQVGSSTVSAHAITLTALAQGASANTIATTETSAHLSFGDTTMDGGTGGDLTGFTVDQAGTYTTLPINVEAYNELIIFLNSIAHSGTTPTLDVKMQISPDSLAWADSGDAVTQVTTSDSLTFKKVAANFGKFVRFILVTAGTLPSYKLDLTLAAKL